MKEIKYATKVKLLAGFAFIQLLLTLNIDVFTQENFGQNIINAQKIMIDNDNFHQKSDFGIGVGLDYGGIIGIKFTYSPIKRLGIFASLGYYNVSIGWQTGVIGYVLPRINKFVFKPYVKIMYGTNRIIQIDGSPEYNDIYYGFTPGIGVEVRIGRYRKHGINLEINYPIESSRFKTDKDFITHNTSLELKKYQPVSISFGYHFLLVLW